MSLKKKILSLPYTDEDYKNYQPLKSYSSSFNPSEHPQRYMYSDMNSGSTECQTDADCLESQSKCEHLNGEQHCFCFETGLLCPSKPRKVPKCTEDECGPHAVCKKDTGCVCKETNSPPVNGACPPSSGSSSSGHCKEDCGPDAYCSQDGSCVCKTSGSPPVNGTCPATSEDCKEDCGPDAYCSQDGRCVCKASGSPPVNGICFARTTECRGPADCVDDMAVCVEVNGNKDCFCYETGDFCANRHVSEKGAENHTPTTSWTDRIPSRSRPTSPAVVVGVGVGVQVGVVKERTSPRARMGLLTTERGSTTTTTKDPFGHGVLDRDQISTIINNTSQGRTSPASSSQSVLLHVVLPMGILLFIGIVIVIICLRRQRQHRLGPKRGSEAVVKSADGVMLLDRMNNISKNPHYFASPDGDDDGASHRKFLVREICMDHIVLVDVVGEGAFGQVYRGEMHCPETNSQQLVAVKVLKENVSNEIREDFEREVEIMSAFDHDNILKLVGVVTQNAGQSPYMIFEYMVHGDLAELLRKNEPSAVSKENVIRLQKRQSEDDVASQLCTGMFSLTAPDLVDIATQIANGMRYLTSQHFVHRDLATRNCLVGEGLVVKISDFGMSRDIYTCDYYKIGGSRMLPVRWMSPESVKYGKFTSESDAWAYGVVLWEIFSLGKQPYYGHSNEEVVRFLDAGILLQRPEDCPSTIYHIMLGCWKADPKERLTFDKIHKHLQDYHGRLVKMAAASQPTTPVATEDEIEAKIPTVASSPEFPPKQPASPLLSKPLLKATQSDPQAAHGKAVSAPLVENSRRSSQTLTQPFEQNDLEECSDLVFQVKLPPLQPPPPPTNTKPGSKSPPGVMEVTTPLMQTASSAHPLKNNGHDSLIKLHAMDSGFSSGEQHWTVPELESSSAAVTTGVTSPSLTDSPSPSDIVLEPLTSIVCTNPPEVV